MTRPLRYGLPRSAGDVSPFGDVAVAAIAVHQRLAEQGDRVVLVDADGHVYLMTPDGPFTADAVRRHPDWHAGNFTAAMSEDDLREVLVHTYQHHLRALQEAPGESYAPV